MFFLVKLADIFLFSDNIENFCPHNNLIAFLIKLRIQSFSVCLGDSDKDNQVTKTIKMRKK